MRTKNLYVAAVIASIAFSTAAFDTDHALREARAADADPVIAAAGDIACDQSSGASPKAGDKDDDSPDGCREANTAKLLKAKAYAAILPLGDEQYPDGTPAQFADGYAKTWGTATAPVRPVPGNHEYHTAGAAGYYGYYKSAAGDPAKGYYSWDIGPWHFIALNANCGAIGGCARGSIEELWLKSDLATHHAACTLAYWHQPRFSSGPHHSDSAYMPFWQDLDAAGADVVLNGHDHDYERFGPQSPTGQADPNGAREFIVGTGGKSHYQFTHVEPNSEVRNNTSFGILELTLHARRYDWRFVPVPGTEAFTDHGSAACHQHPK